MRACFYSGFRFLSTNLDSDLPDPQNKDPARYGSSLNFVKLKLKTPHKYAKGFFCSLS